MNNQITEYLKKISLAISYLSSCVKNNNSIQNAFQEKSIQFLSLSEASTEFDLDFENFKQSIIFNIQKLSNLLEVARASNSISKSQADIFSRNVANFKNFIQKETLAQSVSEYLESLDQDNNFKPDSLGAKSAETKEINLSIPDKKVLKQTTLDQEEASLRTKVETNKEEESTETSDEYFEEKQKETDIEKLIQTSQELRREKIISILKNRASNLTEIKSYFEKVTPKTLQRDISDLMKEKKIIRLGDRRWAKYYLR